MNHSSKSRDSLLENLIDYLGFKIFRHGKTIALYDKKTGNDVLCYPYELRFDLPYYECFNSYKDLENDLLTDIHSFKLYDPHTSATSKQIDNPYLGCKSLEEALIKKDLLEVNTPSST